jgi:hypothetical protein
MLKRLRLRRALPALVLVASLAAPAAVASSVPVLGGPYAPDQQGYGHVRPTTIDDGTGGAGLIRSIHWTSWGGKQAVGNGIGFYITGPHPEPPEGTEQPTRVVLFRLGKCRGRYAYNAIEWFYPEYGQRFEADQYVNACTGTFHVLPEQSG